MKLPIPGFSTSEERNFWFKCWLVVIGGIYVWILSLFFKPTVYMDTVTTTVTKACNSEGECNTYTTEVTSRYKQP